MSLIYLDHAASTPVDPDVMTAMLPYFSEHYANASSSHAAGQQAMHAVERAREQVADVLGARPLEITFTSGATEATNLALKGLVEHFADSGKRHIVTLQTEHPATYDTCRYLETQGIAVTYLPVDAQGRLAPEALAAALRPDTLAVSIIAGHNEFGTVQDLAALGALARANGSFFHVDAAQAFGKCAINVDRDHIDLLSLSGHKLYAPKGIGALYLRRKQPRVRLAAQLHGGGHQRGLRSGTLSVPLIVALGHAAQLAAQRMQQDHLALNELADTFLTALGDITYLRQGHLDHSLPGFINLRFPEVQAQLLIDALPELILSSSAACSSAVRGPSRSLCALGLSATDAAGCLRIVFGRFNTMDEAAQAGHAMAMAVKQIRSQNRQPELCEL